MITLLMIFVGVQFLSFNQADFRLSKLWESDSTFMTPESVVFDSLRNCLYVSNFNDKGGFRKRTDTIFDECISKVDLEGNIIELRWVDNLLGPTGIRIFRDTLYVVEREYLTKINIEKQSIIKRIPVTGAGFLNDVVINKNGDIYISDTRENGAIFRIRNNRSELWLHDTIMHNCNGLFIEGNKLIIGNQGSANLISISIPDKTIKIITSDISNGIDGIKKYKQKYIVSWQYEIFMVDEQDTSQVILNTSEGNNWNADFELIESKNIIIVPTLLSNKLIAYKINYE